MENNKYHFFGLAIEYNIYFELTAIFFLAVMLAFLWMQYSRKSESTKRFKSMAIMMITADLLDVSTAILISYSYAVPRWLNELTNDLYFFSVNILLFEYLRYIISFVHKPLRKAHVIVNYALFSIYSVLVLTNHFTDLIFYFDENNKYVHGSLYYSVYALAIYLLFNALIHTIANRDRVTTKQLISVILFTFFEVGGAFLQTVVMPDVLLNMFSGSLALIIIMLSLETPDFIELQQVNKQLLESTELIEKAKEEAERAKLEAENASVAKSAFLASMSHEIRTPINGVLGMNAIIMKETNDPKILEYSKNIDSAGNGLLSIINDILDLSKIESGKMEINPVEYDLAAVLSSCYNMVFLRATEKKLELLFENNTTIPSKLFGDEIRVRQIIVNLLTNAIKYTENGMVVLTADWEKIDDENMILVVSVKDTGIGIKKKDLDKLFESFERIDEVRNRHIEGTGLGLKITNQFLEMMNGTIEVSSVYGKGSEFKVRIPQKIVAQNNQLGEFATYVHIVSDEEDLLKHDKFKCPEGRILVVDDVAINIKVMMGLLKDTELKIDSANSGNECLNKVRHNTYDIIFLDHLMPEMDGIETLEKMMGIDIYDKSTPVIMLTANAFTGAKEEYLKSGFMDYLSKPVKEDDLRQMLRTYLPKDKVIEVSEAVDDIQKPDVSQKEFRQNEFKSSEEFVPRTPFEKRFHFLDIKTGMTYCLESEEFYESIIREFKNTSKYEEIQQCYDDANLNDYATLVHGIKSSSLTIGAVEVSEMAKALEASAKSEDIDYLKAHHYAFMRKYGELLDDLDEVYGTY